MAGVLGVAQKAGQGSSPWAIPTSTWSRVIPQPSYVTLLDIWQRYPGSKVAILGNGPSLRETPPSLIRPRVDFVVGVNRMWRWGSVDFWVCVDLKVMVGGAETSRWLDPESIMVCPNVHLDRQQWKCLKHPPERTLPTIFQKFLFRGGLHHGLVSEHFCRKGRPGSMEAIRPQHRSRIRPGAIYATRTSIATALHIALIAGAKSVELYGCDGCYGPEGEVNFCPDVSKMVKGPYKSGQLQFAMNWLDDFYGKWKGKIEMVNRSPGYPGSGRWPKG